MQVVILAGGLGTRLGALTKTIPKSMVRVCEKPFLEYQINLLKKNNLFEIVLCVGHLRNEIINYFGDGAKLGVKLSYIVEERTLLGTAGALRNAENLLEDDFMIMNGDSYLMIDYNEVTKAYKIAGKLGLMVVYQNYDKFDKSNVAIDSGLVIKYDRLHRTPEMVYIDYGLTILNKKSIAFIPQGKKYDLDNVYRDLIKIVELSAFQTQTRFYEIGSIKGLNEFSQMIESSTITNDSN